MTARCASSFIALLFEVVFCFLFLFFTLHVICRPHWLLRDLLAWGFGVLNWDHVRQKMLMNKFANLFLYFSIYCVLSGIKSTKPNLSTAALFVFLCTHRIWVFSWLLASLLERVNQHLLSIMCVCKKNKIKKIIHMFIAANGIQLLKLDIWNNSAICRTCQTASLCRFQTWGLFFLRCWGLGIFKEMLRSFFDFNCHIIYTNNNVLDLHGAFPGTQSTFTLVVSSSCSHSYVQF